MQVYIMRGIPGSGKSTWIKENLKNIIICSADHYHIDLQGEYKYNKLNAANAHNKCFFNYVNRASETLYENDTLVVDNTNTTLLELAPYVRVAEAFRANYEIITIHCNPQLAIARNIHNVPESVIMHMHSNILTEKIPAYWNQRIIFN